MPPSSTSWCSAVWCGFACRGLKGLPGLLGGCGNVNAFTFPFFSSSGTLLHRFWAPSGALSWACRMVGRVSCCRGKWYCCVCAGRLDSGSQVPIVLRVDRRSALGFGLTRSGFSNQSHAPMFGVADAVGDPRAASIAVVATWADLAVLLGVFALRASVSIAISVQI